MKAKMKKLSLILFHNEKKDFLDKLQDFGMLHLEVDNKKISEDCEALIEERETLQKVAAILKNNQPEVPVDRQKGISTEEITEKVLSVNNKTDKNNQETETLRKEFAQLLPWGQFDWANIRKLEDSGITIRFFTASKKAFDKADFAASSVAVVSQVKSTIYFVVLDKGERSQVPFEPIQLPEKSLTDIEAHIQHLDTENESLRSEIKALTGNLPDIESKITEIDDQIFYHQASGSFHKAKGAHIQYIHGWIPRGQLDTITEFLDQNKIAYLVEDPSVIDDVPVVLKNRKYSKNFEVITKIFELPNYRELDLTPVIAVFYPIFFAYCLGDSGYGVLFLILFSISYFTFLKSNRVIAALGMILGLFTTVIGILKSGTIFGIPITSHRDIPFFDYFSDFVIVPDTGDTPFNAFNVALMLGVAQIIVGVISAILKALIYDSFEASIASIGKLLIVVSTIVLFLALSQDMEIFLPFTKIATIGLIAGIVLVLLFYNIRLPLFKRIGSGVLPLYFIFTGLLGDILSYIRLFALGISSGILGLVINNIGMQIMEGGVLMVVVGVIFLIFGHALNLFISGLGSFVHPLRLTFVEFYNNAGFQGGGVEFKPFKKESLNENI